MQPVRRRWRIDGFHAPTASRLRRGELSAEGYYRDSFDHDRLEERLLAPFARGATSVDIAAYDHVADASRRVSVEGIPERCALLFDGVFLHRPELRRWWTLTVYLHESDDVALARATARDLALFGSVDAVRKRYSSRYLPGQALYRAEAQPLRSADVVVDNDEPDSPEIVKWAPRA